MSDETTPTIYLLEQAWCDPYENRRDFGWKVVGYIETEADAIRVVEAAGCFRGDETWSMVRMKKPIPKMRYRAIHRVSLVAS